MKILKFGGSSVANAERINHVAEIISRERENLVQLRSQQLSMVQAPRPRRLLPKGARMALALLIETN